MKHILFNFASRSRPDKFNRLVASIYDICTQPFTILAKVDDDDPTLDRYDLSRVTRAPGLSTSKIHAINRDIPATGWDIIIDISDDFVFTHPQFDLIIRKHCGPNDCVHFPEKHVQDRIIIMAVMGNEYYNRFGYIYNPVYQSLFCDDELTAVAKLNGSYKYVDVPLFYHAHPSFGYGKPDRQTMMTEAFWKQDQRTFNKRKEGGFV
jgi:hypothetical protein